MKFWFGLLLVLALLGLGGGLLGLSRVLMASILIVVVFGALVAKGYVINITDLVGKDK